jgi:protein AATF/BFR2
MPKPSLREQLERLASTAPTVYAGEEAIGDEPEAGAPSRWAGDEAPAPVGGARRSALRARAQFEADLTAAGPRYAGKVVSSASVLAAQRRARPEDGGDDEEEEEEEEEDDEEDEDGDEEEESGGGDGAEGGGDGDEEEMGDEEEGGEEDENEDGDGDGDEGGALSASMDAELQTLLAADAAALSRYHAAESEDRARGVEVQAQVRAVDALMESRIKLQRALAGANRYPRAALHRGACAASADVAAAFAGLREGAAALLGDLLELRAELARGEVAGVPPPPPPPPPRRGGGAQPAPSAALWGAASAGWEALGPWRDSTLDKWARKLALGGDGALKRGAKLKVLGARSLSEQVAEALAVGGGRASALTRARRSAVGVPLCHPPEPAAGEGDAGALDEETFDDGDLYAALLKDFLAAAAAGEGGGAAKKRLRRVTREGVDRRASKARKLK